VGDAKVLTVVGGDAGGHDVELFSDDEELSSPFFGDLNV